MRTVSIVLYLFSMCLFIIALYLGFNEIITADENFQLNVYATLILILANQSVDKGSKWEA